MAASIFLLTPAAASANYSHVVAPGETLTSIAATDGLSISALAAANGMSPSAPLVAGTVLQIPPQSGSSAVSATSGQVAATPSPASYVVQAGDTLTSVAQRAGTTVSQLAAANGLNPNGVLVAGTKLNLSGGGSVSSDPDTDGDNDAGTATSATTTSSAGSTSSAYVVRPGDTLTSIAQRAGTTVAQLAAANGLSPSGVLVSGRALTMPQGGVTTTSTGTAQPVSAAASGGPYPTPQTVSGSEISSIAAANGVPSSLAQAIGWQESGWNNNEVSSVGAVGVMQIVPSTWQWIQQNMAGNSLAPASATDNVRGGVLLLRSLLSVTGSDSMAAAGYYQGLSSIRAHGLYPDTQQYVNSVMDLQQRFGGG
ncbi:MAG TPA: LysM peptidoglycan-binding domain-containing protein [Solirubrobacteraceae bacterium]|nr:LysM peptidoglycan-binding domain-containing protein [Solirubrobacteraceae bacterium]